MGGSHEKGRGSVIVSLAEESFVREPFVAEPLAEVPLVASGLMAEARPVRNATGMP